MTRWLRWRLELGRARRREGHLRWLLGLGEAAELEVELAAEWLRRVELNKP